MGFRIGERVKVIQTEQEGFIIGFSHYGDIKVLCDGIESYTGFMDDEIVSVDAFTALQAELAAALARAQAAEEKSEKLQAVILDMDQARRWGGQRMNDDAMDAFRRLESRIKAAMKLIS